MHGLNIYFKNGQTEIIKMIPLYKIHWDNNDIEAVSAAIREGMYWAGGANIEKFEEMIAEYMGVKGVVTFNSGTSALHALLLAHGISSEDEVIVPSFTFIATANCVKMTGAAPVFADIEPVTCGLDIADVESKITDRTVAIILVHYAGMPALNTIELMDMAKKYGLLFFEDAAESMGAVIGSRKTGSFGTGAILSFCSNKIITTGEGGAALTNSGEIYEKLKLIRSHGRSETVNYFESTGTPNYITLGYNYRMSNITAALGISQIQKIDWLINMRRHNAWLLSQKLSRVSGIVLSLNGIYQMYSIRVEDGQRDALQKYLAAKGISSKVFFEPPVHLTPYYKSLGYNCSLPVTEQVSQQVLSLPMYPDMRQGEIDYIARSVIKFFGGN